MNEVLSVCLIGKNEERCIGRCLSELSKLSLPIVYTDTGSTDRTIEIASEYTNLIYHFDWCNDFSKARNFCAAQAPTDWIWFIDCDEYVIDADSDIILNFCNKTNNKAKIGTVSQRDFYILSGEQTYTTTKLGRIYNRCHYHYIGAVHEQLAPINQQNTTQYFDFPILIEHDGYNNPEVLRQKCERNAKLLTQELSAKADPYLYFQLGKCYSTLGFPDLAADAFSKGLEFDLDPSLYYVQSMVESYGYCLLDLKQYKAALSFENIYDTFAVNADFVFLMGLIYMNNALFDKAIEEFKKATDFKTCVVAGSNSYRAQYNIGVIFECTGDLKNATCYYHKCGTYEPAQKRLAVLSHDNHYIQSEVLP